jgi:hypothetical protein
MKRLLPLVITAVFLTLAAGTVLPLAPTAVAQQADNQVRPAFSTRWTYDSSEDIFINGKVTGSKSWHTNTVSGVPLTGLTLTLDSKLNFDFFQEGNLATTGPPTHVWSFGDIPPGTNSNAYVGFNLDSPGVASVNFIPGFDASRSVDKTVFSSLEPSTQTITIALTPREVTEGFHIYVQAFENENVDSAIISPIGGEGIDLSRDGHELCIWLTNLQLDKTWTTTITIRVTSKKPTIEYLPSVEIGRWETLASGTASGNSLSLPVADMGTWTWSTEDRYEWYWRDTLKKQVSWRSHSTPIGATFPSSFLVLYSSNPSSSQILPLPSP